MSIKTNFEFPRGESPNDVIKQGQRLAQDLSKNFKSISKALSASTSDSLVSGIDGVEFSSNYSVVCPSATNGASTYTFTHNFGALPTGYIVTDLTSSNTIYLSNPVLTRDSWTTTQITIRLSVLTIDFASSRTQSGAFKILVLR